MNKLVLLLFVSGCSLALAQDALHTSTITLGVGGTPYSYTSGFEKGGPAFTGNYEYRLSKYLAVEGGTDILLPSYQSSGQESILYGENLVPYQSSCTSCPAPVSGRARVTLLTYGFKGILPLANGRLELFGGIGGAYAWNSEFNSRLNATLGQASLGARLAMDRDHRFWLGTTLRGFTNFGSGRQAWVPLTFDLGIRFGH